jgi:hypothetical protein
MDNDNAEAALKQEPEMEESGRPKFRIEKREQGFVIHNDTLAEPNALRNDDLPSWEEARNQFFDDFPVAGNFAPDEAANERASLAATEYGQETAMFDSEEEARSVCVELLSEFESRRGRGRKAASA